VLTTRHPSLRKKLTLTSPSSGGRSVGMDRSRAKAMELLLLLLLYFTVKGFQILTIYCIIENVRRNIRL
jgi:hypothetical protein